MDHAWQQKRLPAPGGTVEETRPAGTRTAILPENGPRGGGNIVSPMVIAWVVFACVFGGALRGLSFRFILPEHHLSAESKDVVKPTIALVATMSALVLGLLIASAKNSYDKRAQEFTELSADIILLDRMLAHYGPETDDIRSRLRLSVGASSIACRAPKAAERRGWALGELMPKFCMTESRTSRHKPKPNGRCRAKL